ncbi:hypothetical protein MKX03_005643, partial [Papaver bracteatum]
NRERIDPLSFRINPIFVKFLKLGYFLHLLPRILFSLEFNILAVACIYIHMHA